ncbi:Uncharacterized protein CLAVI_000696 [Candidatus Clavichlamydia salmonicola]|uniref:RluA family pseudouridine synthase n=1 Tax=Candidatus Clavichlamydia salmonicola TaxID=469812 RepID=UPI0018914CE5|nr:RluA family pseudouridine synthase [Candidatus Clavichlamydia salmonicola]MBF5051066.1 Uncharacterized protein [Candidatus Clavichlamydia salmonicola]
MNFLYKDNHLIVCNKASGCLTQTNGFENSLECQVRQAIKDIENKSGNVFIHALHRLDKPVSGIVVFAKTGKALTRLQDFQRQGFFKKVYFACVEGDVAVDHGVLEHELIKEEFFSRQAKKNEKGRLSYLEFFVLWRSEHISCLKIILHTGFYHQIRLQMHIIGHPIIGDAKYGNDQISSNILLHHGHFECPHPISKEIYTFEAPLPSQWRKFINDRKVWVLNNFQKQDYFSI